MSKDEMTFMFVLYIVWWIICTSRIFLIRGIRNILILIAIGTLVSNGFEMDLVIFSILAFHPIYIKLAYNSLKYYLASR